MLVNAKAQSFFDAETLPLVFEDVVARPFFFPFASLMMLFPDNFAFALEKGKLVFVGNGPVQPERASNIVLFSLGRAWHGKTP